MQSQWPEGHICERDAGTTTSGKCLRGCKILPRKIRGRVVAPYCRRTAAYVNAGRDRERGVWRTVLFYLRWCRPAVLRGRSSNGRMFPSLAPPLPIKTTQGGLLGAKQNVKGTRAMRIECTQQKRYHDASSTCLPVPLHTLLLGKLSSWSSRENRMRNVRKGSTVSGPSRWRPLCQIGTQRLSSCGWRKQ